MKSMKPPLCSDALIRRIPGYKQPQVKIEVGDVESQKSAPKCQVAAPTRVSLLPAFADTIEMI